jgi:hypothetical protein
MSLGAGAVTRYREAGLLAPFGGLERGGATHDNR